MATGKTNGEIYDLIDRRVENLRRELKTDLKDLATSVEGVKSDVSKLSIAQAISATKIGTLIASISIVVSATVTVLISKLTGKSS